MINSLHHATLCWRDMSCGRVSICMSVGLFIHLCVTGQYSTKTVKRRNTQTTSYDSPGTLVFWWHRFRRNSSRVTP